MLVSFHNWHRHDEHWKFAKGWQVSSVDNARDVARVMLRYSNSAIVWENGERSTKNFKSASWAVLDVDSGATIKDAINTYGEYQHVIGTTKSHQKTKGKEGPRDRFRVWVKLENLVCNHMDYTATLRQQTVKLGADDQACDGARKFLPCSKIVHGSVTGKTLKVVKYIPPVVETSRESINRNGFIPAFIKEWLERGAPDGMRNRCAFKTGLYLAKNGFTLDEIFSRVLSSNLANGLTQSELKYTLARGFNARN